MSTLPYAQLLTPNPTLVSAPRYGWVSDALILARKGHVYAPTGQVVLDSQARAPPLDSDLAPTVANTKNLAVCLDDLVKITGMRTWGINRSVNPERKALHFELSAWKSEDVDFGSRSAIVKA